MKYFITEEKRKGTCYFEFQKGKFKGKFWLQDSLYLHGDEFDELMLFRLFSESMEEFNYYGTSEVNEKQWEGIIQQSRESQVWKEVVEELTPWAMESIEKYKCFTICGI